MLCQPSIFLPFPFEKTWHNPFFKKNLGRIWEEIGRKKYKENQSKNM
jgi:hypothetical protein